MNIALIGYSGTGKTTIAKLLAKKLDKKLISTDDEIVKKTKMSVSQFVKKYGREKFLDLESEIIENVSGLDECVFDTKGDIVIRNENIINVKKSALIVMLTADTKTIMSRSKSSKSSYIDETKGVLQEHEFKYEKAADYAIDTSRISPEEACHLISHYIQMELKYNGHKNTGNSGFFQETGRKLKPV